MCRPGSFLNWPLIITCLKTSFNDEEKSTQCKQSWSRWVCGWLVVWAPLRRANEIFCRNSKNFFRYEGVYDQYLTLPKEIILFCFTIKVLFANFKLLTVWSLSKNICESDSNTCSRINFQDKKLSNTWKIRLECFDAMFRLGLAVHQLRYFSETAYSWISFEVRFGCFKFSAKQLSPDHFDAILSNSWFIKIKIIKFVNWCCIPHICK